MISRPIESAFPDVSDEGMIHNMMFPASSHDEDHNNNNMLFSLSSHSVEAPSSSSLLFNLSVLKDKLTQMQTLTGILISQGPARPGPTCSAISSMNSIIQEFIVTASSMMLTCQHMLLNWSGTTTTTTTSNNNIAQDNKGQSTTTIFSSSNDQNLDWFGGESYDYTNNNNIINLNKEENPSVNEISETNDDIIIEVNAADLLAKYTHYCKICGKGFKRDANLRMHMRAHGDEYKTSSALSNPVKLQEGLMSTVKVNKKYSCPQEGCRWNKKHARFQPLKSMICVKNHYKRSHCPKMYVCKRCNLKQFSVLSDLRTHEKHCGDLKWQCSCGTTFSRKDKLAGHLALFVGHAPMSYE